MAKRNVLQSLMEGFAVGSGVPTSMLPSVIDREEQAAAAKASLNVIPDEIMPDLGLGLNLADAMAPELAATADPGMIGMEGIEPPPTSESLLKQVDRRMLDPEGQVSYDRIKAITDEKRKVRPGNQAELEATAVDELERADLESHIIEPPSIEKWENDGMIRRHDNGMVEWLRDDGNPDVKDFNSKSDLEQMKLQSNERTSIQQMQQTAKESRREKRQEEISVRRQQQETAKAKAVEERSTRFQEHYGKAIETTPMSERYAAAKKSLEASYKRLNPKRAAKKFTPSQIQQFAQSQIAMDFQSAEIARNPQDPFGKTEKLSPRQGMKKRFDEDPEAFREEFDEIREEMQQATLYDENPEPITNRSVLEEMEARSPESIGAELEAFASQEVRDAAVSTEPVEPEPLLGFLEGARDPDAGDIEQLRGLLGASPEDAGIVSPSDKPVAPKDRAAVEKGVRMQLSDQLGVAPESIPDKDVKREFVYNDLPKRTKKEKTSSKSEGKVFYQDLLPGDQEVRRQTIFPIFDDEDFEQAPIGHILMDAETGELIERNPMAPEAEQFLQWQQGGGMGLGADKEPIVQSDADYKKLKVGDWYMNANTGVKSQKRKGESLRKKRGSALQEYLERTMMPLGRQAVSTMFGE